MNFQLLTKITLGATLFIAQAFLWSAAEVWAQASCKASVGYAWQPDKGEAIPEGAELVQATGKDEVEAKAKLQGVIAKQAAVALKSCRSIHEDSSGCIKSKLDTSSTTRANLSFTARKALEDAAVADCKKLLGTCKEGTPSEAACVIAQSSSSAGEEKKDTKAEKGKKK